MKNCMVYGDMAADRASEQYPVVALCEGCIDEDRARGEGALILSVEAAACDPSVEHCDWCGNED